jgi:PAS domain S-box-containing protein
MSKNRDTAETTVTSADPVAVLSTFRLAALKRTSDIVLHPSVDDDQYRASSFSHLAALLASALEFLRVAEESLRGRTAQDQAIAEKSDYDRGLFDLAPVPLLLTTVTGLITEANRAAVLLLGEDTFQLDRRPMAEFIACDERQEFRDRLERMTMMERATHWRFRIRRRRDLPLSVSAVVCPVARMNRFTGSPGLFWYIKTATEEWLSGAEHDADATPESPTEFGKRSGPGNGFEAHLGVG